jgi:hydrogenase maturation protease
MVWLVIGIGNTLRRDDGLGHWLAERVADWRLPGVAVRLVHQLTPELAADFAEYDRILFLDACHTGDEPRLTEVPTSPSTQRWGHAASPGYLMALAAHLDGRPRLAWMVPVPGSDFGFGEELSPAAHLQCVRALAVIRSLIWENAPCTKSD